MDLCFKNGVGTNGRREKKKEREKKKGEKKREGKYVSVKIDNNM